MLTFVAALLKDMFIVSSLKYTTHTRRVRRIFQGGGGVNIYKSCRKIATTQPTAE